MLFEKLETKNSHLVSYGAAWAYQKQVLAQVIERGHSVERILLCEHLPVVTRGRGLQRSPSLPENSKPLRSMPLGALPQGVEYFEVERGGDLTWHGPGQLTLYPILKVEDFAGGLHGYLRALEEWVITSLADMGLPGCLRKDGSSGVWTPDGERKIASLGIACRKWVAYHGVGLNLFNSIAEQAFMNPCGFDPQLMTNFYTEINDESSRFHRALDLVPLAIQALQKNCSKIGINSDTTFAIKYLETP